MYRTILFGNLLCVVFLGVGACESEKNTKIDSSDRLSDADLRNIPSGESGGQVYLFGFDLRSSPEEDARQYLPFLKYLERETGHKLELSFTPAGENIVDRLGRGEVHFAAIGAVSYIDARERYGVGILARGLNAKGKAEYRSKFVVSPGSPIRSVEDLKGRKLAFGSVTSTQGHLIPHIVLESKGLGLDDLSGHEFTGSHLNCANAVISGEADACGMQDTMADDMVARGLLKVLHVSEYFPSSGIAANKSLPRQIIDDMQRALLAFQPKGRDKAGLYNWEKSEMPNGFVIAKDEDYASMRESVIKIGLLDSRTADRK